MLTCQGFNTTILKPAAAGCWRAYECAGQVGCVILHNDVSWRVTNLIESSKTASRPH